MVQSSHFSKVVSHLRLPLDVMFVILSLMIDLLDAFGVFLPLLLLFLKIDPPSIEIRNNSLLSQKLRFLNTSHCTLWQCQINHIFKISSPFDSRSILLEKIFCCQVSSLLQHLIIPLLMLLYGFRVYLLELFTPLSFLPHQTLLL